MLGIYRGAGGDLGVGRPGAQTPKPPTPRPLPQQKGPTVWLPEAPDPQEPSLSKKGPTVWLTKRCAVALVSVAAALASAAAVAAPVAIVRPLPSRYSAAVVAAVDVAFAAAINGEDFARGTV